MNDMENAEANPQIILAWKAPLRAYKKRKKNVLRFYLALALLLSLLVFFFADKILLLLIWAVLFLFYVLTITPPPEVDNKITKFGIETAGVTIRWELLSEFYFTKRFGFDILTVVTHAPYYIHAYLVIPNVELKRKVVGLLSEHLIYQERPHRTFTDRMIDWFSKLMPDDEDDAETTKTSSFHQTQAPASL